MLAHKKELLEKQMEELKESLAYIDWKQEFYDDVQSGRRPYSSNLLPSKGKDEKS